MQDDWTEKLSCAISCHRCEEKMDQKFETLSLGFILWS
jgi:hypothetical protein